MSDLVSVCAEREDEGEDKGEKRKEKREEKKRKRHVRRETRQEKRRGKKERERATERERERERRRERRENPPLCTFKTPPCVRSGRLRVYRQQARMSKTVTTVTPVMSVIFLRTSLFPLDLDIKL